MTTKLKQYVNKFKDEQGKAAYGVCVYDKEVEGWIEPRLTGSATNDVISVFATRAEALQYARELVQSWTK